MNFVPPALSPVLSPSIPSRAFSHSLFISLTLSYFYVYSRADQTFGQNIVSRQDVNQISKQTYTFTVLRHFGRLKQLIKEKEKIVINKKVLLISINKKNYS